MDLTGAEALGKAIEKVAADCLSIEARVAHTEQFRPPSTERLIPWRCDTCRQSYRYSRTRKRWLCGCPERRVPQ